MSTFTLRQALPNDKAAVIDLLSANNLLTDDLSDDLSNFLLAFDGDVLVGSAGVDLLGGVGLLRSVAVRSTHRGQYIGQQLLEATKQHARQQGVHELYLITTTADQYFDRLGFLRIERNQIPAAIAITQQFSSLCPASSVIMKQHIS